MKLIKTGILFLVGISTGICGNLNVIHLGPDREVEIEVKAGGLSQKFKLPHGETSGGLVLPKKKGSIRTIGDDIKSLEIKPKEAGQLAVLYPSGETFRWKLWESKPSPGKTSFRIVNLSDEATSVTIGGEKIEIKEESDVPIASVTNAPIRVTLANGQKQKAHEMPEAGAAVGFLYKEKDEWHLFFLNDN